MQNPLAGNQFRTRADVQRAVGALFSPLLPHFSASAARVRLSAAAAHFDQAAAELEGFARPLWGIAPLVAGGGDFEHWARYREGLSNGTDPDHSDYWGDISDIDQRQVELAAIGFSLRIAKGQLWDPLDAAAKRRIAAYLISGREHEFVDSNWKFFRVLIDLGLAHCGVEVDPRKREAYLDGLEGFAIGNGWYRDGPIRSADHYIPFAFHYYGLIYAALSGDKERAARYRERAGEFARSIRHWYAPDGSALPFGRSLTYRFAHAGFWGALAFASVEALPWGQIKGYYLRNLRWWARQPMFDRDGVLSIGYAYPNLMISEGYNSAGSPYWAMKAFLPLALPGDHPFWACAEEGPETFESPVALPEPGMVAQHLPGHVVALASGQEYARWRGTPEKYGKFAYSTRYGFSLEGNDRHFPSAACDGMLGLSEDGLHLRMRESSEAALIAGDRIYARWRPYEDVIVQTWLVPTGRWHVRLHEVTTPRRLEVVEGGFAVPKPDFGAWSEAVSAGRAEVATAQDVSVIVGYDARAAQVISPLSNTNVMAARTLLPQLRGVVEAGTTLLACAVLAEPRSDGDVPPAPECPDVDELRRFFRAEGRVVSVFDMKAQG
ncbi:DUF2264 domain-containing protein [Allomesorhizobium camelthorni]|uniref:DUF2264 domain-containing protein n=1 Tax=Allomesorhizobium camelthorni TaxID=475069 RepID=A0A6G4WDY8_9HYPH|nr:DUF2264 domain-containing protein [Mesorhizobium camelthorni]NGO52804.1 DUF2264 domain-containing protein [Mesorhizobium camelthorni]